MFYKGGAGFECKMWWYTGVSVLDIVGLTENGEAVFSARLVERRLILQSR